MMASSSFATSTREKLFSEIQENDDPIAKLSVLLRSGRRLAEAGAALELLKLCNHIPAAIKRIMDDEPKGKWCCTGHVYEVFCELVELAVSTFSTQLGDPSTQAIHFASVPKLLHALHIALDSGRKFYNSRRQAERDTIVVCPWRLECAIQVPGFFVKVRGAIDNQANYLCSHKRINHIGAASECCKPPPEADPMLANLSWLLAKTASGSVYEYVVILKMLKSPQHLSLPTLGLLLQSFVQFLDYNMNNSDPGFSYMGKNLRDAFKDICKNACSEVLKYLNKMVPGNYVEGSECKYHQISLLLSLLYKITCCRASFYGDGSELDGVRGSVCELQQKMWEQLLAQGRCPTLCRCMCMCTRVVAVLEATVPQASGEESMPVLKWLQKNEVMAKLLGYHGYTMDEVPRAGVVPTENENEFLTSLRCFGESERLVTSEDWIAHDLIVAAMLEILDVSAISVEFLGSVLKWLEDRKAESVINGSRIFFILKKLVAYDKNETWEKRFLALLSKHGDGVSANDLMDCLRLAS